MLANEFHSRVLPWLQGAQPLWRRSSHHRGDFVDTDAVSCRIDAAALSLSSALGFNRQLSKLTTDRVSSHRNSGPMRTFEPGHRGRSATFATPDGRFASM